MVTTQKLVGVARSFGIQTTKRSKKDKPGMWTLSLKDENGKVVVIRLMWRASEEEKALPRYRERRAYILSQMLTLAGIEHEVVRTAHRRWPIYVPVDQ